MPYAGINQPYGGFIKQSSPLVSAIVLVLAASASAQAQTEEKSPTPFKLGGYVEAFYQWNFNNPSNGITNVRGFDNRHNSFTLSNVALDVQWDYENLVGHLTLQVGHTPSTYYLGEPNLSGSDDANASNAELWKYLQQAYAGYRFGLGRGLTITAGLFLTPIGPETIPVHENWNWSRSTLFFELPYYHTGIRASYPLSDAWEVSLAGYNGWNSVVDNNDEKSVCAQVTFTQPEIAFSALYFGGVERNAGAPEGRAWRHLLDSYVTWHVTPALSLRAHANGGFEPNEFGVSHWLASALYARLRLLEPLFVAARVDAFYENAASDGPTSAAPIFVPADWVSSATATLDYRPHERVSFRLEFRHDHADSDLYYGGTVGRDATTGSFTPNRQTQNTLTLGATTWF